MPAQTVSPTSLSTSSSATVTFTYKTAR
jgi:hypothetical protein